MGRCETTGLNVTLSAMAKTRNNAAYIYLAPALIIMALCAVLPMLFVAYYSVHDTFSGNSFVWVGAAWFLEVLSSQEFYGALLKSFGFSLLVLAIEIPLGIAVALRMPVSGKLSSLYIVLMTIPLLTPSIVVGYLWKVLTLPHAGLLFEALQALGTPLNMNSAAATWAVLILMDVWHWTGLVVLLCFAGLRSIPHDYYRAAQIDGASPWKIFRYIQLPKLKLVLLIAIMLRFMDSFMIYTEAYIITRGGPGVSTTFLSHALVQTATIEFDLGHGGAMSVIYFVFVLLVAGAFFKFIVPKEAAT
jgi:glycerol transport system permease protein